MENPYHPPKETEKVACPECGSTNTGKVSDTSVKSMPENKTLHQYVCSDCKCNFIPAMESKRTVQESWARKIRISNNLNEATSWAKEETSYIVLKREPIFENAPILPDEILEAVFKTLSEDKAFTKLNLVNEVALQMLDYDDGLTPEEAAIEAQKMVNKYLKNLKKG